MSPERENWFPVQYSERCGVKYVFAPNLENALCKVITLFIQNHVKLIIQISKNLK